MCAVMAACLSLAIPSPATTTHSDFDVASINAALRTKRPYTIQVLGDSTGNARNEWVHLLSHQIADRYHRRVTVHDWQLADDGGEGGYQLTTVYGQGPQVVVWNASGPGKDAQWSLAGYDDMVPDTPDLTLINHGHNNPVNAVSGITNLVAMAHHRGSKGVVVVLQNPRVDKPERAKLEADTYRKVGRAVAGSAVVVDVFDAYPTTDVDKLLLPDRIHPNDEGQQLWADTVAAALDLR
jgi:hypothetical protein